MPANSEENMRESGVLEWQTHAHGRSINDLNEQ